MISVGTDIQDVKEFRKKPYSDNKIFYTKLFTVEEIRYCLYKKDPYQSFACRFCAKEATIKAMGGVENVKSISDIEIIMKERKPYLFLNGVEMKNASVSMSHIKNMAIATVILY